MSCYYPLKGYRASEPGPNGKRAIVFNFREGYFQLPVSVPCGQCIGCKLERSRQWALRCTHEASLHEDNCFITLTFDDTHLPADYSVNVRDFQLFMKRLKSYVRRKDGKNAAKRIRFFHCGEYGDKYGRPHYHAILFGYDFHDKVLLKTIKRQNYYISDVLSQLWPFGHCVIGDVTFQSAAYVARYCLKKLTGPESDRKYQRVHPLTGEIVQVRPEYATMSRRPGLGKGWYDKFKRDAYPHDFVVHDGQRMRPPVAYDRFYELDDPVAFRRLKFRRSSGAGKHTDNNTSTRHRVREEVHKARASLLKRDVE